MEIQICCSFKDDYKYIENSIETNDEVRYPHLRYINK